MTVVRVLEADRPRIVLAVDGVPLEARQGDTLLTALLVAGLDGVRTSEFGDGQRAGFCWMGACQDCWVLLEGRGVVRACTTLAEEGMRVTRR
ncbi:(2Fe-2S)-binding protein [Falsiroseomonas oryzae]|uniref:(2Fe-2S)-binding protein n=1 Tax=Falsiroseomonas oryzae TaxID=2766473 RepID=UPI0022EAD42D|nr:(2Fe-2S)-binding protein [Roseomonas sp. MO-31]